MTARHSRTEVMVIAHDISLTHGGGVSIREMCLAFEEIGLHINTITAEKVDDAPETWSNTIIKDFWRPACSVGRSIGTVSVFLSAKKISPAFILVVGELPRLSYIALQALAPIIFNRRDGILCCPANTRHLPLSNTVCTKPFGWNCLKVNKEEGCLQQLSAIKRIGRIILRKRDTMLMGRLKNLLFNSDYLRCIHGYQSAPVLTPFHTERSAVKIKGGRDLTSIAFVARMTKTKGTQEALKIIKNLPDKYRLKVIGEGPDLNDMKILSHKLELEERVEYKGWLNRKDLTRELASCGVVIVPSLWDEAFGRVGPEAMHLGTPVVAYDVGGIREWCTPPGGTVVPCGQTDKLAEAIQAITKSEKDWLKRSRRAIMFAQDRFSKDNYVTTLKNVISPFIQGKR